MLTAPAPPLPGDVRATYRPSRRARGSAVVAWAAFAVVAGLLAARTVRECNVPGRLDLPRYGMQDFRDAVYFPAVAFRDGANPYDFGTMGAYPVPGRIGPYAPAVLLLYAPFSALTLPQAEVAFFIVNLVLVPLLARLVLLLCGVRPTLPRCLGLATAILLSRQGHSTVFLGQCTMYVVIGAFLALRYARTAPWLASLGFALATLKPTFGIPLGVLMLVRKDWMPVVVGGAVCGVLSLVALARLAAASGGVATVASAFMASPSIMHAPVNSSISLRIDTPALFERLASLPPLGVGAVLVMLATLAVGAVAVQRAASACRDPQLANALTCLTVLACIYHQNYDGVLLALPVAALAFGTWRPSLPLLGAATRPALLAALLIPALNYVSTFYVLDRIGLEGAARALVASVNGAATLAALIMCVALAFSGGPSLSRARLAAG